MDDVKIPPAPRGLGVRGRKFWRLLQEESEFDGPSTEVLVEVCRTLDRLEALEKVISEEGVTATGSTGQRVVHPAVPEARQLQLALTRLVDALGLPSSDEAEAEQMRARVARAKKASAVAHGYLRAVR